MPTVRFNLIKNRYLNLSFSYKGGRFRSLTHQAIDPKYWNKKAQRVRSDINYPEHLQLNHLLDAWSERILNYYRSCLINKIIPDKLGFTRAMSGLKSENNPYLKDFALTIMNERKKSPEFSINTIKKYNCTLNLIIEFNSIYKKNWTLSEIGMEEMNELKNFFLKIKNHSINSCSKYLKQIKALLNEADKRSMAINHKYKLCKIADQQILKTYLNSDELKLLLNFNFNSDRLRNAVDLFLIGAYSGLRFSDFSQLKPENIEIIKDGPDQYTVFRVKQFKTKAVILVPIHPAVMQIMKNHNGLPRPISQVKLNEYIKEACNIAGINNPSIHYFNEGGYNKSKVASKHELISTHTARRSFATNAFKAGVQAMDIMKITGHRTEASFRRYICIDIEESAIKMAKSAYYQSFG